MLIQIYIYTLKVKENIYTLYSNTNRNTVMEKTTLQLIRKVEEKTANKIESRPGYLEFPYTGNRPSQSEKSSRREENINV